MCVHGYVVMMLRVLLEQIHISVSETVCIKYYNVYSGWMDEMEMLVYQHAY